MKISKLLVAVILGISLASCGSHKAENAEKVSQNVKNKFAHAYPEAEEVKWEVKGDKFEANFKWHFTNYEVTFDKAGDRVEIEYGIDSRLLPEGVLTHLESKYSNKKIQANYVDHFGFTYYEVEVENGDKNIELAFDMTGKEFDMHTMAKKMHACHSKKASCHKPCDSKKSCSADKKAECHGKAEKACCGKEDCNGKCKNGESCKAGCEPGACKGHEEEHGHHEEHKGEDHH